MSNEPGPQLHLQKAGANKYRVVRGLYILWKLVGKQSRLEQYLGHTPRTVRNAFAGFKTEITFNDVKRAARQYLEDWREEVEPYEWAALLDIVRLIDPQCDMLHVRPRREFSELVKKQMDSNAIAPASATFWHFVNQGVDKKHIRQTMRRLMRRFPYLTIQAVDPENVDEVKAKPDVINKFQRLAPLAEYLALRDGKKVKATGRAKPVTPGPKLVTASVVRKQPVAKKKVKKDPAAEEPNMFDIIEQRGVSKSISDKVDKILARQG